MVYLLTIFPQLVETKKPTGDSVCPPHVHRAHEIDHKLQCKVVCRDLEDGDIIEIDNNEADDSDDEMSDSYDFLKDTERDSPARDVPIPHVRITCVEAPLLSQESVRQSSSKGTDILEKISKTFDPEVQSCHDTDRASSMFQTQQLIMVQSQICDLNSTILSLRNQLDDSEHRCVDTDRRADRIQNQIDIASAVTQLRLDRSADWVSRHTTPISISSSPESTPATTADTRLPSGTVVAARGLGMVIGLITSNPISLTIKLVRKNEIVLILLYNGTACQACCPSLLVG